MELLIKDLFVLSIFLLVPDISNPVHLFLFLKDPKQNRYIPETPQNPRKHN